MIDLELSRPIDRFGNYGPYHESLGKATPADVYFGYVPALLSPRREITERTMSQTTATHEARTAEQSTLTSEANCAGASLALPPIKGVSSQKTHNVPFL